MQMNLFSKSQWQELDLALSPLIKKALSLPRDATTDYLYGDTAKALFGIPEAAEDSDIAKLDTAFKLLTSPFLSCLRLHGMTCKEHLFRELGGQHLSWI